MLTEQHDCSYLGQGGVIEEVSRKQENERQTLLQEETTFSRHLTQRKRIGWRFLNLPIGAIQGKVVFLALRISFSGQSWRSLLGCKTWAARNCWLLNLAFKFDLNLRWTLPPCPELGADSECDLDSVTVFEYTYVCFAFAIELEFLVNLNDNLHPECSWSSNLPIGADFHYRIRCQISLWMLVLALSKIDVEDWWVTEQCGSQSQNDLQVLRVLYTLYCGSERSPTV